MDAVAKEGDRAIRGEGTTEDQWHAWTGLRQMRTTCMETLVPVGARAVVVAPHPDDEVLAVGGLLAQLARLGGAIRVIAVTDGTASHRGSRPGVRGPVVPPASRVSRGGWRCRR